MMGSAMSPLLDLLFAPCTGLIELRAKPVHEGNGVPTCFLAHDDANRLTQFVGEHLHGHHLFFGVATRRNASSGTLANCLALPALFCDLDFKLTIETEARRRLYEFPLAPSAVVLSGHGLHVYWMLREPLLLQDPAECARAKSLLRRIAHYLGADLVSAEPAHCLRLPGTLNPKYDPPRQARLDHLADELELQYHTSEFDDLLPPEPVETRPNGSFVVPEKIVDGTRNSMLYRAGRLLKAKGFSREAICAALSAENRARCQPPVSNEEVERIVESAWSQLDREAFLPKGHAEPPQEAETLTLTETGGLYTVTCATHAVCFTFDRLTDQRGRVYAELTVTLAHGNLLSGVDLSLKSDAGQTKLAENLTRLIPALPWKVLLQKACTVVLTRHREGEPTVLLSRETKVEPLTFLINPFVYRQKPTILYGDGGQGKSTLALFLAMLVSTGQCVAEIRALRGRVLYLDYEDDADIHALRLRALIAGHPELAEAQIDYQRCAQPLTVLAPSLYRRIQADAIQLLVIDSLFAASGGMEGDDCGRFFAALRPLKVASLTLAHTPKPQEGVTPSIIGSVFNKNYALTTWELRAEPATLDAPMHLGLYHRKINYGRERAALGFAVVQAEDFSVCRYEPLDLAHTADLASALPLRNRIRNLLEDGTPRTTKEIADEVGVKLGTVKSALSRGKRINWQMIGEGKETKWTVLVSKT